MPEIAIWHMLGQLMREGIVQPWSVDDMSPEMLVFYIGVLETEAKLQKKMAEDAKKNAKKNTRRIR